MLMETSSLPILVSLELSASLLRHTLMKLLLYGTELLRFCWARNNTLLPLTSGLLVASSLRWLKGELSSLVTQKSTKSSKYSKFKALPTRITGPLLLNSQTSRLLSPSGRVFLFLNTLKTLKNMALTCLPVWLLSSLTRESLAEWQCNTPISMTLTKVK
jgi:hypothetical protein